MAPLSLKIILEEGTVCRTILFTTDTTVREALELVLEKFHNSVNHDKAYGLFLTSADCENSGVWLETHRTLDHYMLRDGDTLQYLCKIRNLRVRLLDDSVKTFQVDESKVISEVLFQICSKMQISNHDEYGFCREERQELDEAKSATGTLTLKPKHQKDKDLKLEQLSKKLKTDDNVEWLNQAKTLREVQVDPSETLLFKRRLFYSDRKIDARDPVQLNLLYVQTRDNILSGRQVTTEEKAVEFAGIQCQVHFGDYEEDKHKPGFIENLEEYLPKQYASSWGIEKKIYREYRKHSGLSQLDAKYLYTKIAREHPTYGVTFFLVKEQDKHKKKRLVPCLLGINANSILRLDEKTKEILKVWLLTQVKSYYAGKSDFTLNFGDYSDKEYAVKTNEAYRIRDILEGYIDIIRKKVAGPSKVYPMEGQAICEDNVEKGKGTIIQTVVPQKLVEHSFVGSNQIVAHEIGQEVKQGTHIVTVQQIILTKKGDMKQQAMSGMTGGMPADFNRRMNHLNTQSVQAVMLLGDPSQDNLNEVRAIADNFDAELPAIAKGIEELAQIQTSEEDKKRLLDDLDQIRKYLLEFSLSTRSSDIGASDLEKAEDAVKKIAELSSLVILSSDPRIRRRSELLRRSRKSFIADERIEATLRRASFLTVASSASKAVEQCLEKLVEPYEGPPVSKDDAMKLKTSAADKLAKLNAAVASLLAARADPKNVDYEVAVNSMITINELTPSVFRDAKALGSIKDSDYQRNLLNRLNALCQSLNSLCNLTGPDEAAGIQDAANKYAKASNNLIYVFNPKERNIKTMFDPDKATEIIDLAKKAKDKTSGILLVTSDLSKSSGNDPHSQALDEIAEKCAGAAVGLVSCTQITAPTIHEPHCQSALTAAAENLSSSVQQLASVWKPLVEKQQNQHYGKQLDEKTSKLMKALEKLKKAYSNLDEDSKPEIMPKPVSKDKSDKKLQLVTSLSTAKHCLEQMERELQDTKQDLEGKPIKQADSNKERLLKLLSQKIGQLNAAMASVVHALSDREDPDYEKAVKAITLINELNPDIVKGAKDLCQYENEKMGKEILEEIAAILKATRGICSGAEHNDTEDMYESASNLSTSSGKLCYVFNPRINPEKENHILELSRSACEIASVMLSKVYALTEAVAGEDGTKLDDAGARVVNAGQALLTVAQITAPSITNKQCQSALITSADKVSNLTKDLASLWEPIIQNPEHQALGDHLTLDRESLETILEELRDVCRTDGDVKRIDDPKRKQRLAFMMTKLAAKKKLEEAEKLLQSATDVPVVYREMNKDAPVFRELQRLLVQQLAELNAAMAALVRANSDLQNPDYEEAESAMTSISQLTPEIIQNTNKLCPYVDEKQRNIMLDNIRSLCKANKYLIDSMDKNDIQELNNAANKYANSSGKLCYIFNPRANSMKENQILEISKEACEKTSLMLARVYELAELVGGEQGSMLDLAGAKVVDAAQILLTTAQVTAVSISDGRCQSELVKSADTVSELTQELATIWEPIIRSPNHQALGKQINEDRQMLEAILEKLKNVCRLDKDMAKKPEDVNYIKEKQRVQFTKVALDVKEKMSNTESFLQDNTNNVLTRTDKLNKNSAEYKELRQLSAQKLAELNAAVASLMHAAPDLVHPDYTRAEIAISTISQNTPEIVQNTSKLCEYEDESQRHAMLENVRAVCAANKLLCEGLETNDSKMMVNAVEKFSHSSRGLYYVFNPCANVLVENQIIDLSKAARAKTSDILSSVHKLKDNIGEEDERRLEGFGDQLDGAAQKLLLTAQVTAPSITNRRCQTELNAFTDLVSKVAVELASVWEPITCTSPSAMNQSLGDKLNDDQSMLEKILEKLKHASNPKSDMVKLMVTMSAAKEKNVEAENFLTEDSENIIDLNKRNENSVEYKTSQHHSAQKLVELNAVIAGLVRANSDKANPEYETTGKEILKISHLTPEIVQNTKTLSGYMEPKQREGMLNNVRELCKANKLLYDSIEKSDNQKLTNAANKFADCSAKLYKVFHPPAVSDCVKENLLLDLSKAANDKVSELLSLIEPLVETIGGKDGSTLDKTAFNVAGSAQELMSITRITAPSIIDGKCQAILVASAKNLSYLTDDLSSKWSTIVQDSTYTVCGEKLYKAKKDLDAIIEKLISECKVKPAVSDKPQKPEPPIRKTLVPSNEEKLKTKHIQFCNSVDIAKDKIKKAEEDLKKPYDNSSFRPVIVGAQEKLQNLIENQLALAGVAVSHIISDMGSEHVNYDSAIRATKVLTELIPEIVKEGKDLGRVREDCARKEFLADLLSLCEVSTELCDNIKNNSKKINDVAVEFGNKAAKLLYNVSSEAHPAQEKEVVRRAREIGDSASRLAGRGAEGAVEVRHACVNELCAAATHCAHAARDFMYTAKLVGSTIQNVDSHKALQEVTNQLSSKAKEFFLSWQPLNSDETYHAFTKELDTESKMLTRLLEDFNLDLKNEKFVKRRVIEKLVVQDTPLRQLACNILETIKAKAEVSDSPEERRHFLDYSNKLSGAIRDLDVANAKCRNSPQVIHWMPGCNGVPI